MGLMKIRNVPILQYERGQKILATDVNSRLAEVFNQFNQMGPSDCAPFTTGQFRTYEPIIGWKLKSELITAANWTAGNGAADNANQFTCNANGSKWYILADGVGVKYSLFTVGNRYTVYANVAIAAAGAVGLYNGDDMTDPLICGCSGGIATYALQGSFVATSAYFTIGGTAGPANMQVTINNCPPFSSTAFPDKAIYVFDWDMNEWIIPNYCGWQTPPSSWDVWNNSNGGVYALDRRENPRLLEKAIGKEIAETNEVLRYL